MVLGEPGDCVAELVREPRLLRNLGKHFHCRLFGVARPHQIEDAEFHRPLLRSVLAATVAAIDLRVKLPGYPESGNPPDSPMRPSFFAYEEGQIRVVNPSSPIRPA